VENSIPSYVLDSFALLAYLEGEAGAEQVSSLLALAQKDECRLFFSLINLGEVLYIIERERGINQAHLVLAAIQQMSLEILPADMDTVFAAAHIKACHPVANSDAFAAAAAQQHHATLVTGDAEFQALDGIISIIWLPKEAKRK